MNLKKSNIDWLNHALEFIVVLIGILLAFQLENYSQKKQQDQLLEAHRYSIYEETKLNRGSIAYTLKGAKANLKNIEVILQPSPQQSLPLEAINQMALELLKFDFAYIKRNAYTTLTESGDVRNMSFQEKTDIINLYEYYGWINSIQFANADIHRDVFVKMVRENLDMSGQTTQPIEFYQSKTFKNAIISYQKGLERKITKYQDCLEIIDQFIARNKVQ